MADSKGFEECLENVLCILEGKGFKIRLKSEQKKAIRQLYEGKGSTFWNVNFWKIPEAPTGGRTCVHYIFHLPEYGPLKQWWVITLSIHVFYSYKTIKAHLCCVWGPSIMIIIFHILLCNCTSPEINDIWIRSTKLFWSADYHNRAPRH